MNIETQASDEEIETNWRDAEQRLRAMVDAFVNFPTDHNYRCVIDRMEPFRTSWMNYRLAKAREPKS